VPKGNKKNKFQLEPADRGFFAPFLGKLVDKERHRGRFCSIEALYHAITATIERNGPALSGNVNRL
jgi:hypothetical protein